MAQHKHFELMSLFLEDARVSETPWMFWQKRHFDAPVDIWFDCNNPPGWDNSFEYRRKPRTVNINGFDVPEPMRVAPDFGSAYFVPYICRDDMFGVRLWGGDYEDILQLNNGVCHATKEAAVAHSKALLSFTEVKS